MAARRILVLTAFLVPWLTTTAVHGGNERIPLENWSYRALERFETLGMVTLPEDRPFSRVEMRTLVRVITERADPAALSARDRYQLDRLHREFLEDTTPDTRYDRAWYARDGSVALEADGDLTPSVEEAPFADEVEVYIASDPTAKVHLGERVTYDMRYRLLFGPEHGDRARNQKPSRREKSFKGLTALFDRSYAIVAFDKIHLVLGRDAVDWGPSADGGLIVPGARHGIDQIGLRVFFKSIRLDAFYGQLFTEPERYMIGHRLEGTIGRTVVGVSETVVYGGRGLDMLYFWPVAWFYANQFNERTNDDNILWSLDAKSTVTDGLTLHGTVLIDDFQFERDEGYPDKLGFDAGFRWVPSRPLGLEINGAYRRADIYTYSHLDSLSRYVSGAGEIGGGDTLLGGEPGPDADAWRLGAIVYPRANVAVDVAAFGRRVGEGSDLRPFDLGVDDADPAFPSGVVETTLGAELGVRWEFEGDRWIALRYARQSVENRARVAGADEDTGAFRLEMRWDIP